MATHAYGFEFGPMDVSRLAVAHKGALSYHVLGICTAHHRVQVSSSKTGRSVRVWIDGKEVRP